MRNNSSPVDRLDSNSRTESEGTEITEVHLVMMMQYSLLGVSVCSVISAADIYSSCRQSKGVGSRGTTQITLRQRSDAGPTTRLTSDHRCSPTVGQRKFVHRTHVVATSQSGRRRTDGGPTNVITDVNTTLVQRRKPDSLPTSHRRISDSIPTMARRRSDDKMYSC